MTKNLAIFYSNWMERAITIILTSLSASPKVMFSVPMALIIATKDCIVLLYTTGLYCLLSSLVKPPSWIILERNMLNIMWWSNFYRYHCVCSTKDSFLPKISRYSVHCVHFRKSWRNDSWYGSLADGLLTIYVRRPTKRYTMEIST